MEGPFTNYIKTEGDFTFTRESTSPLEFLKKIQSYETNKAQNEEQLINLTKPTMSKQHKVAVFTVIRNEKNEIISSKFYKEGWIEVNSDQSINLLAAKQFKIPVDLFDSIVVKKINEVTL